jgi:hypothetical protein
MGFVKHPDNVFNAFLLKYDIHVSIVHFYVYYIVVALKLYDGLSICKHHPKLLEMVTYLN